MSKVGDGASIHEGDWVAPQSNFLYFFGYPPGCSTFRNLSKVLILLLSRNSDRFQTLKSRKLDRLPDESKLELQRFLRENDAPLREKMAACAGEKFKFDAGKKFDTKIQRFKIQVFLMDYELKYQN